MKYLLPCLFMFLLAACDEPSGDNVTATQPQGVIEETDANPAAEGFNVEGSDPTAIALADSIVAAHGGRRAYDDTRYLKWNFFGFRQLTWDKQDQRVRIEVPSQEATYLLDYGDADNLTGKVSIGGEEITQPDSLDKYLTRAHSIFINDSYWLVQPFKLKDSGVTLDHLGRRKDPITKADAEALEMRFDGVGDTPDNRYVIYVDPKSYRFLTWEFYRDASDEEPAMTTPYRGYARYGDVYLSSDRGERKLSDIEAPATVEEAVFEEF